MPDEVIDRFCVLGPVEASPERLEGLSELGVDQFSLYLMHDDPRGRLTPTPVTSLVTSSPVG